MTRDELNVSLDRVRHELDLLAEARTVGSLSQESESRYRQLCIRELSLLVQPRKVEK